MPPHLLPLPRWVRKLKSQRMFANLIARNAQGSDSAGEGAVVGCLTLTMRQVEAALPPPFPTKALPRLYVCNMAVSELCRRRGIAKAMLRKAERIGAAPRRLPPSPPPAQGGGTAIREARGEGRVWERRRDGVGSHKRGEGVRNGAMRSREDARQGRGQGNMRRWRARERGGGQVSERSR